MDISDIHFFCVDFKTVRDHIKGELFVSSDDNNVDIKIGGFLLTLCSKDEFSDVCGSIHDFDVGKILKIDDVIVEITDVCLETIDEFNRECERIEMEDMMFFED